ncbi:uncharacterized protein LOC142330159 [Lycorma delicatula]|uniref:uncharacterized protein LOC142330159 n=1 Tax=Lycorma delicatula TaxID=130591 RepID=UPI003F5146E4
MFQQTIWSPLAMQRMQQSLLHHPTWRQQISHEACSHTIFIGDPSSSPSQMHSEPVNFTFKQAHPKYYTYNRTRIQLNVDSKIKQTKLSDGNTNIQGSLDI